MVTGGTGAAPIIPPGMTPGQQPSNPTTPVAGSGSTPTTPVAGNGGTPPQTAGGSDAPVVPEPGPDGMTGEACRGFSYDGIKYSPGGSALPNKCMPFNPTSNNPYAVRCVDVWPWYKTKYPGDNFCILPPPPDKGIQYGVHPQGRKWFEQVSAGDMSGYDNPTNDFIMEDGEEEEANYLTGTDNAAEIKFYRNSARMRGGSHHMIVSWAETGGAQDTWTLGSPAGLGGNGLPGAQRPDENAPKSLEKPAEDKGLYSVLGPNAVVTFNMHHFNPTGMQILKEAWTNLWFEEDATIRTFGILGLETTQVIPGIGLNVAAGQTADYHYSFNINSPVRVVTLFGHRHAWTTNFSSWVEKPGGATSIVYQSFDWYDEPTYRYDSMTMNPPPAPETRKDGAHSGILTLQPGEKLHFNCHIEFTDERAMKVNSPVSPADVGTLRFANQAFNAEMCILFGSTAAMSLGTPTSDSSPLPDFATMD